MGEPPGAGSGPAIGAVDPDAGPIEPRPPRAALLLPATLPAAAPLPGTRLATTEGPGYRAVFSCARIIVSDTTEE